MARPKIIDVNKNEIVFYPLSIKVNKYSGNCKNINDPMAKLCVPDIIIKDMNIKVFNMLARISETRKITWHETCKCICRFTKPVCNDKQEWDENKCKCECKEDLINKLICDKGYMWNPSTCTCDCHKYCGTGQYLDYDNCVCRKKLIDYLIEECASIANIDLIEKKNNRELIFLVLYFFLIVGLIYHYRKNSNKKY